MKESIAEIEDELNPFYYVLVLPYGTVKTQGPMIKGGIGNRICGILGLCQILLSGLDGRTVGQSDSAVR